MKIVFVRFLPSLNGLSFGNPVIFVSFIPQMIRLENMEGKVIIRDIRHKSSEPDPENFQTSRWKRDAKENHKKFHFAFRGIVVGDSSQLYGRPISRFSAGPDLIRFSLTIFAGLSISFCKPAA